MEDDKNLDILEYIEKIDTSTTGASDAEKDAADKVEASSTSEKAEDSLDTKIKKLGLTDKLPEAFKEAYLTAKQKQLDAECEEIMKDKEILEVIKALETDPVSFAFIWDPMRPLLCGLSLPTLSFARRLVRINNTDNAVAFTDEFLRVASATAHSLP